MTPEKVEAESLEDETTESIRPDSDSVPLPESDAELNSKTEPASGKGVAAPPEPIKEPDKPLASVYRGVVSTAGKKD